MSEVKVPEATEELATAVVNAAFVVHRTLGPGLLESAYHECLGIELSLAGLRVQREQALSINYRGQVVPNAYRIDLLIDDQLLVELKTLDSIQPIHRVQVTTYLRLLRMPLGILINFNTPLIKNGITRVLNLDFRPSTPTLAPSRLRA